ncbi:MAG: CbtA family protein [Nocardioidaceae bacterium]|nr:CbtA family protein [Nocardioidaceae bacterium]MCL2613673.1 CbtA family protein [Nocardioidaceae bacterium]
MVKQLIGRGALSGAVAGLVAFLFARIFAEPIISKAIAYESARDAMQDKLDKAQGLPVPAPGPDIFSRTIQMDVGIGAALILFGAAMGALVAVGYVIAIGRVGRVRPFTLALLIPAFYFAGAYFVPFLKYPANPPAIGHENTIKERGALFLVTVAVSCIALFLAVYFGQKLHKRLSLYSSVVTAAVGYMAVMAVLFLILPPLGHLHANVVEYGRQATETPLPLTDANGKIVFPGFPADLLAKFRVYSIVNQVILWGGIALLFAPQAQRLLDPAGAKAAKESRLVEGHTPVAV